MVAAMLGSPPATSSESRPETRSSRSPRPPEARSYSSAQGERAAFDHGGDSLFGQLGAAQVGVQHGAGQVEDRAQVGARRGVGAAADGGKQRGFIGQRQAMLDALAGSGQFGTDAAGDQLAAVGFDQGGELPQDAVEPREGVGLGSWLSPGPGRKKWIGESLMGISCRSGRMGWGQPLRAPKSSRLGPARW